MDAAIFAAEFVEIGATPGLDTEVVAEMAGVVETAGEQPKVAVGATRGGFTKREAEGEVEADTDSETKFGSDGEADNDWKGLARLEADRIG